jgi:predicted phosphodiesterase
MRIRVLSDLHNEFGARPLPRVRADLIVLAGDIDVGAKGLRWAEEAFQGTPVLYVAGNHEYYGHSIPKLTHDLGSLGAGPAVTFLEKAAATIDGVRFLGCTLWSDFTIGGDRALSMAACRESVSDFSRIRVSPSFRRLRPSDQASWHRASLFWLEEEIVKDPSRTIVVTHHAPSLRSLNSRHRNSLISGAFASDLDTLVAASGVPLWIHGHTHYCVDYTIGRTRVINNGRGYPHEYVPGFDPALVVEV